MSHFFEIIILGIIEGLTEFLPISSTGHLLIAEKWLPRQTDMFNVVIQCGAVLAVLLFYWNHLKSMVLDLRNPENKSYLLNLIIAFVVTGIGGVIAKKLGFKLPEDLTQVGIALLVGGILFLMIEKIVGMKSEHKKIDIKIAIIMGIAQIIAAVFPGASRSGTTILAALLCGVERKVATEFSFVVGIPTMFAAGFLQLHHALKETSIDTINWTDLGTCTIVSGIVAFLSVKWLLGYLQKHSFQIFGWYRIVVGLIVLLFLR